MRFNTTRIAGFAVAVMLMGCLENPGPDKELNKGRNHTLGMPASYPGGYLQFIFRTSLDKSSLEFTNIGQETLDSGVFLFQATGYIFAFDRTPGFLEAPEFQYYGKFKSMAPYQVSGICCFGYQPAEWMSLVGTDAVLLKTYQAGRLDGSPLGGFYSGTFQRYDTLSGPHEGPVHGTIDADGYYQFWFSPVQETGAYGVPIFDYEGTNTMLLGRVDSRGVMKVRSHSSSQDSAKVDSLSGNFQGAADNSVLASFRYPDRKNPSDSLTIRLIPITPK